MEKNKGKVKTAVDKDTGKKIVCQDQKTCPFGGECNGGWDSIDPQTGRLCRDSLKRNFALARETNPVTVLSEGDFAEGRYKITWEGSDPLDTHELKDLKELIEKWAMGDIPDKTIALQVPRVLAEFISRVESVDDELARRR